MAPLGYNPWRTVAMRVAHAARTPETLDFFVQRSHEEAETMMMEHYKLVYGWANYVHRIMPWLDMEDLESLGQEGLWLACLTWEPERARLSTWTFHCAWATLWRYDPDSRLRYLDAHRKNKSTDLKIQSLEAVAELRARYGGFENGRVNREEVVPADEEYIGANAEHEDDQETLAVLMDTLSEREKLVIGMLYGLDKDEETRANWRKFARGGGVRSDSDVARTLNISRERVRQLKERAYKKMRARAAKVAAER